MEEPEDSNPTSHVWIGKVSQIPTKGLLSLSVSREGLRWTGMGLPVLVDPQESRGKGVFGNIQTNKTNHLTPRTASHLACRAWPWLPCNGQVHAMGEGALRGESPFQCVIIPSVRRSRPVAGMGASDNRMLQPCSPPCTASHSAYRRRRRPRPGGRGGGMNAYNARAC